MRGDDAQLVAHQHRLLEERQNAAAQLGMRMYGFRIILKNTFATDDLDTVMNQIVFRSQGHLQQFVDDRDLFIRVVGEIIDEFQLRPPIPLLPPPVTQDSSDLRTMMQILSGFVFSGGKRPLDHLIETSGEIMTDD